MSTYTLGYICGIDIYGKTKKWRLLIAPWQLRLVLLL